MGDQAFHAQQFSVQQDRCAMKVSTDGIILGTLANIMDAETILDIGTGTGLLALMCAQRNERAGITAVELDGAACEQAAKNFSASPWADRIELTQMDVRKYNTTMHDAIICNPPYYERSLRSPNSAVNQAKHSTQISLTELFGCTKKLLTDQGQASFIFPKDREAELMGQAVHHDLFLTAHTAIRYQVGHDVKRIVATFSQEKGPLSRSSLVVQNKDNSYTDQYRELTAAFLLKSRSN